MADVSIFASPGALWMRAILGKAGNQQYIFTGWAHLSFHMGHSQQIGTCDSIKMHLILFVASPNQKSSILIELDTKLSSNHQSNHSIV